MRHFSVSGTQIGENGVNYGPWLRWLIAENADKAKTQAVELVKSQGPTAHVVEVTSVVDRGEAELCQCCGNYHD